MPRMCLVLFLFMLPLSWACEKEVVKIGEETPPPVASPGAEPESPAVTEVEKIEEVSLKDMGFSDWLGRPVSRISTLPECHGGWERPESEALEKFARPDVTSSYRCAKGLVVDNQRLYLPISVFLDSNDIIRDVFLLTPIKGSKKEVKVLEELVDTFQSHLKKALQQDCSHQPLPFPEYLPKEVASEFSSDSKFWTCDDSRIVVLKGRDLYLVVWSKDHLIGNTFMNKLSEMFKPAPRPTINLGDFSYNFEPAEKTTRVGRTIKQKASKGGIFVIVPYTLTNNAKETKTVLTGDLELRDQQGRTFRNASKAVTALSIERDLETFIREVQPGLPQQQVAVFEVPEEITKPGNKLTLIIPEKGVFGSKQATHTFWFTP